MLQITYGNGATTDYTYDPQTLRLDRLQTVNSAQTILQDLSYQFDAVGNVDLNTGDIRAHLWAIDPYTAEQFNEDGSEAISQVSLQFACKGCHVEGGTATVKSDEELQASAENYHARP